MNLLEETIDFLKQNGKTSADVIWIGDVDGSYMLWEDFLNLSKHYEYENMSEESKVPWDLVIVGEDWWLARAFIDGTECWEYLTQPTKPEKQGDWKLKL